MTKELDLIDTTVTPNPWDPVDGDIYSRPSSLGWDRVCVIAVEAAANRPAMHDITEVVPVPCMVTFIDSHRGETLRKTADLFRAWITCYGMRPAGRLRKTPVETAP